MKKIRVLIVEDHPFFRSGLAQWLNQQEGVTCCGEAESVVEARKAVEETPHDVILMDLRLGDGEGLDLIVVITQTHPHIRSVALTQVGEDLHAGPQVQQARFRPLVSRGSSPLRAANSPHQGGAGGLCGFQGFVGQGHAMGVIAAAAEQALVQLKVRGQALRHPADLGGDFGADPVAGQEKKVGHARSSHGWSRARRAS
jgi:DNA-binding NarL/FixJ family response regulator